MQMQLDDSQCEPSVIRGALSLQWRKWNSSLIMQNPTLAKKSRVNEFGLGIKYLIVSRSNSANEEELAPRKQTERPYSFCNQ